MEQEEFSCLDEGGTADAIGALPKSHWHHQSCLHTHHLPPTQASVTVHPQAFSGQGRSPSLSREQAELLEEFRLVSRTG